MPTGGSSPIEPQRRAELWAVAALLVGAALTVALVPPTQSLMGSWGAALGGALRGAFGVGAAAFPLMAFAWAAILFGHFERSVGRRLTVLLAGLAVLVPFALAIIYQNTDPAARAEIALDRAYDPPAWLGVIGAFFGYYLRPLGPVGEGLIALGSVSALTILTVGWSPFDRLKPGRVDEAAGEEVAGDEAAGDDAVVTRLPAASPPAAQTHHRGGYRESDPAPRGSAAGTSRRPRWGSHWRESP